MTSDSSPVARPEDASCNAAVAVTRSTYDDIAIAYADANRELPDSVVESLEHFLEALPAQACVADVGCGPGRDLAALRARGVRAVGFDLSLGMLRAGGMSGVALADMTVGLPVADASLDGIWCAAALLHVPRPLVPATITGFAAALRPAGRLHLSVSEGTGEGFERDSYIAAGDRWFVHHEEAPLVELLARSGLVVVNLRRSKSRRRWLTLDAVRREGRGD